MKYRHPMSIAWDRIHPGYFGHLLLARSFLTAIGAAILNGTFKRLSMRDTLHKGISRTAFRCPMVIMAHTTWRNAVHGLEAAREVKRIGETKGICHLIHVKDNVSIPSRNILFPIACRDGEFPMARLRRGS